MRAEQTDLSTENREHPMKGKTIAVVGGGPAGAFFAYLLARQGIGVEIFEPRSVERPKKPETCTGCAGILQQGAIELLRKSDLMIPDDIIQNRVEETAIHMPETGHKPHSDKPPPPDKSFSIDTPDIKTVFRGNSPLVQKGNPTKSFDAWLLSRAIDAGAKHHQVRVAGINLKRDETGKVHIIDEAGNVYKEADMVIGAFGYSPELMKAIEYPDETKEKYKLELPRVQMASVKEFFLGKEKVEGLLDGKLHIFGNPTEKIWFAAVVPKGDYISVVLMGREDVKPRDFTAFFANEQVKSLVGNALEDALKSDKSIMCCGCLNPITVRSPDVYMFADSDGSIEMVNLGDAGPTRPRKNGIGAAFESAWMLAELLGKYGNTQRASREYRRYINRTFLWDNYCAEAVLKITDFVLNNRLPRRAVVYSATHDIRVITKVVIKAMKCVVSGETPYWKIPLSVLEGLLTS